MALSLPANRKAGRPVTPATQALEKLAQEERLERMKSWLTSFESTERADVASEESVARKAVLCARCRASIAFLPHYGGPVRPQSDEPEDAARTAPSAGPLQRKRCNKYTKITDGDVAALATMTLVQRQNTADSEEAIALEKLFTIEVKSLYFTALSEKKGMFDDAREELASITNKRDEEYRAMQATAIQSSYRKHSERVRNAVANERVVFLQRVCRAGTSRIRFASQLKHMRLARLVRRIARGNSARTLIRTEFAQQILDHKKQRAAVVIQKDWRMYVPRNAFLEHRVKVKCAKTIQRQIRIFLLFCREKRIHQAHRDALKVLIRRLGFVDCVELEYAERLHLRVMEMEFRSVMKVDLQHYRRSCERLQLIDRYSLPVHSLDAEQEKNALASVAPTSAWQRLHLSLLRVEQLEAMQRVQLSCEERSHLHYYHDMHTRFVYAHRSEGMRLDMPAANNPASSCVTHEHARPCDSDPITKATPLVEADSEEANKLRQDAIQKKDAYVQRRSIAGHKQEVKSGA